MVVHHHHCPYTLLKVATATQHYITLRHIKPKNGKHVYTNRCIDAFILHHYYKVLFSKLCIFNNHGHATRTFSLLIYNSFAIFQEICTVYLEFLTTVRDHVTCDMSVKQIT